MVPVLKVEIFYEKSSMQLEYHMDVDNEEGIIILILNPNISFLISSILILLSLSPSFSSPLSPLPSLCLITIANIFRKCVAFNYLPIRISY
jgi:hypothetical protein